MLKSWSIENFKAIVNSGELSLAPVTVLAGLNSSGKSSLLQSILMISQTLSSRVLDRPLLPNGPIVQLGTFEDILNENLRSRGLIVGFELQIEKEGQTSTARRSSTNIKSAKIIVEFIGPGGNSTSFSAIEASRVSVESVSLEIRNETRKLPSTLPGFDVYETDEEVDFHFSINKVSNAELKKFLFSVAPDYLRLVPSIDEQDGYLGERTASTKENPELYLTALSHFLPARLFRKIKIEEHRKRNLEIAFSLLFETASTREALPFFDKLPELNMNDSLPENLKRDLRELCKGEDIEEFQGHTLRELAQWYRLIPVAKRESVGKRSIEILVKWFNRNPIQTESENERYSDGLTPIYLSNLEQAVGQITRFFTSRIRYLGPLRADPQAAQRFAPSSELDDVGVKGEYAAAVYDANQNARIKWYNPQTYQIEQETLKIALDSWARYLGVANQIKIEMAGQSGVGWQVVHRKGQKPLPLTAVGVGVSQILPILVMGLLAPGNTLLIVEQPELHLHPRVQARLGDFFVGLSKCQKQCLIETHSENLVNQLRYHIVQAGGRTKSDCLIYFVDQDEKGATRFEPVEVSERGNILNWPEGFFDETMLQQDKIRAAYIRRRAKSAENE